MTDAREQFYKVMKQEKRNKLLEKYFLYLLIFLSLLICFVCTYFYLLTIDFDKALLNVCK